MILLTSSMVIVSQFGGRIIGGYLPFLKPKNKK